MVISWCLMVISWRITRKKSGTLAHSWLIFLLWKEVIFHSYILVYLRCFPLDLLSWPSDQTIGWRFVVDHGPKSSGLYKRLVQGHRGFPKLSMAIFMQFLPISSLSEKPEGHFARLGYIRRWLEWKSLLSMGVVIYNWGYIIKVVFITHERYWFLLPRLSATFDLPRPTCVRIINWFNHE